jgi:hypothetical protein
MGMIFEMKFKTKEMLKHVLIWDSVKWWENAVNRDDSCAADNALVRTMPVEKIPDSDASGERHLTGWLSPCELNVLMAEIIVAAGQRNWMLWLVERFPQECTKRVWGERWWRLQFKWLDASGTGGMDPKEQVAGPSNSIPIAWERDVIESGNAPSCCLQCTCKIFDTAPIMIWDDDCNDQLEVSQGTKLGNDGRLHLPKSGCGVTVLTT